MQTSDYDKFAEDFSKTRQVPWKEVIDFIQSLPKNSGLLDIGCGNGRHLIEAKKRGLNAIGLDISKNLLKIAKRKAGAPHRRLFATGMNDSISYACKRAPLIIGNALALPFKNCAIDYSICIAVVHHFKAEEERINCLNEIARITKKSSIVSVLAFEQKKFSKRKSPDIQLGWNKEFPRFYHLFKDGEINKIAGNAGLKARKVWRSKNNYWALLEKS